MRVRKGNEYVNNSGVKKGVPKGKNRVFFTFDLVQIDLTLFDMPKFRFLESITHPILHNLIFDFDIFVKNPIQDYL